MEQETLSLQTPESHARFKDAIWYGSREVTVIGAGGIGSWLSLGLTRAGHKVALYDFDTVEKHNLGGQLFSVDDIGIKKTKAVLNKCTSFSESVKMMLFGKFEQSNPIHNTLFVCPDNMKTRKEAFETWYGQQERREGDENSVRIMIDGRLEAETLQIYVIDSVERAEKYKSELFDDSEIDNAPCTFRATTHNAMIIAGLMIDVFNNAIANKKEGVEIREVPYKLTFEAPTLTFDVET